MATFLELAQYVIADLAVDGDSQFTFPKAAPYYNTPFGKRLAIYLKTFTAETYLLYAHMEAITVQSGDRFLNLDDSSNCAKSFFHVDRVWLNNNLIERRASATELMRSVNPSDTAATPYAFAQSDRRHIVFNSDPGATISNCYASGCYRHPSITDDSTVIEVEEEYWELFSNFAGVLLRSKTASDDVGLTRLQMMSPDTKRRMDSLRVRNLRMQGLS